MDKIFIYTLQALGIIALLGVMILGYKTYQYLPPLTLSTNKINLSAAHDGLVHYKVKEGEKVLKNEIVAYFDYNDLTEQKKEQNYTYRAA
ncbi:MAG: hypothetical protein GY756_24065 [bacterium]|nr:hypothetical protein [bacterium]